MPHCQESFKDSTESRGLCKLFKTNFLRQTADLKLLLFRPLSFGLLLQSPPLGLEAVKRSLEGSADDVEAISADSRPPNFYSAVALTGLRIDHAEPGRVVCSLTVPPCLRNDGKYLHSGVISTLVDLVGTATFFAAGYSTSGVSVELNVSHFGAAFVGEEIEIEAKLLNTAKPVGVTSVEFRKKKTGKLIAQARHTKYLAVSSKL